jgi:hypothetical protein
VNALWESFNDVAEGFGLNQDEMAEICRVLQTSLEIHARADMDQLSAALFGALDTDEVRHNTLRNPQTILLTHLPPPEWSGRRARVPWDRGRHVGHDGRAEAHLYVS